MVDTPSSPLGSFLKKSILPLIAIGAVAAGALFSMARNGDGREVTVTVTDIEDKAIRNGTISDEELGKALREAFDTSRSKQAKGRHHDPVPLQLSPAEPQKP